MRCWRCGGNYVDYQNGLGYHCMMCCRTPDRNYWENVELLKARQKGNPKTYGTDVYYKKKHYLDDLIIPLLSKLCRE